MPSAAIMGFQAKLWHAADKPEHAICGEEVGR
jgi:hypothetical protein